MYSSEPFDYARAGSWEEAVRLLEHGGEDARPIAGGQSLVPMMMLRLAAPSMLVDLCGAGEPTVSVDGDELVLSALVRHADLESSEVVRARCPMLAEAASQIGNVRVRRRGTIGGSLAHGEPTAELATVAVAQRATVRTLGPSGERSIPASELILGHLTTCLEPAELITEVRFPLPGARHGGCFMEIARRAGDFAIAEVAASVTLAADGRCEAARLVVGAVSHRPLDVSDGVARLIGEVPDEPEIREVAAAVASEVPIGPHTHASEDYRRALTAVLISRALGTAARRAMNGGGSL